jgi:alkylation response protein AidB-like acyl-CoA dehydrogenase
VTTTEAGRATEIDDGELLGRVAEWLDANWDPDLTVREWWSRVGAAGWTAPHFPVEWGGLGYDRRAVVRVRQAFHDTGAVMSPGGLGLLMAAPTILSHGTQEQIDRLVPPVYDGSIAWCQLFSEPGAGSDAAAVATKAKRVDGGWW